MNGRDQLSQLAWSATATVDDPLPQLVFDSNRSLVVENGSLFNSVYSEYDNYSDISNIPYPDFTQIHWVWLTFIVVYAVVIILSIIGNCLVCITVYRNKKMHTAVNYYIVNLAICDLLVGAFVMPVKLLELAAPAEWQILSDSLCTFMMYFQTVFVFTSVLTLVATCIERYFAIVHPLESRMNHSKSRAKRILFLVWITPCAVAGPFMFPAHAFDNYLYSEYGVIHRLTCFDNFSDEFRQGYYIFLFFFIYLLSLIFITGTCICISLALLRDITSFNRQGSLRRQESNRRKVAKMILVVVFSYIFFWTPYFLVTIITQFQAENFLQEGQFFFTMLCVNFLAFTNSCVNPFIYGLMSVRFRHGFRSIFVALFCCVSNVKLVATPTQSAENTGDNPGLIKVVVEKQTTPSNGNQRCSCINNLSSSDSPPTSQEGVGGSGVGTSSINSANNIQVKSQPLENSSNSNCLTCQNENERQGTVRRVRNFWNFCKRDRSIPVNDKSATKDGLFVMESLGKNMNISNYFNSHISSICRSFTAMVSRTKLTLVSITLGKSCKCHEESDEINLQKPQETKINSRDKITQRHNYKTSFSNPNLYSSFAVKNFQFQVYHSTSYRDFDQPAIILEESIVSDRSNQHLKSVDQTSL